MSDAQAQAVMTLETDPKDELGMRDLCTAVALGSEIVITAAHCVKRDDVAMRFTTASFSRDVLPSEAHIVRHDTVDLAVVKIAGFGLANSLPWSTHDLSTLSLQLVELAGAGISEERAPGAMKFAVARVKSVSSDALIAELTDIGGPCGGDSGGPLLIRGPTGAIEVAGILTQGAPSCRGPDSYLRLDQVDEWLIQVVGVSRATRAACGSLGEIGRCFGRIAAFCEGGIERGEDCGTDMACGWDETKKGYRCVEPLKDPCEGVTDLGSCSVNLARRCVSGTLEQLSCDTCGAVCTISSHSGKSVCS